MTTPIHPQNAEELRTIVTELRAVGRQLASLPLVRLLEPLDRLAALWQPGSAPYVQASGMLSGLFSQRAVEASLQNLAHGLKAPVLMAEVHRELGRADLLDTWHSDEMNVGYVRGYPFGVVAHILAGNVFLGGVVALAQSLLTRNAVLLKLSREDSGFTTLFANTLRQVDQSGVLSRALAICSWDSSQEELNAVVRSDADAVVVWGGASAIAAYPAERCRGRVIHYGPRLGIGLVLAGTELDKAMPALAWDVALWEQRACSSPRLVLVEDRDGTGDLPRTVADRFSRALHEMRQELPARSLNLDEKAEVLSIRELAWWSANAEIHQVLGSMAHTVLLAAEIPRDIPLGYRTVLVVPIARLDSLPAMLQPFRAFLQTAVLAAPSTRWPEGVDLLVRSGLTQVSAAGAASARVMGLPHEGEYALRRLVQLIGVDLGAGLLAYPNRNPAELAAIAAGLRSSQ
jgi:phenylacetate-CoA ligase